MVDHLKKHMRREAKRKRTVFFAWDDYNGVNKVTVSCEAASLKTMEAQ